MERNWLGYLGGPEKAIDDGVIISLNDAYQKYAPNITTWLKANPDIDKLIRSGNGTYYVFPFIRFGPKLRVSNGLLIRRDWLDELGLEMPRSIDEWHAVLTAFKQRKGIASPLSYESGFGLGRFEYAWKLSDGYYINDTGAVEFGPTRDRYREVLMTLNRWYNEGLLDKDFLALNNTVVTQKVLNGETGATYGMMGSRLGVWTNTARANGDNVFNLVPAPFPVLNKGDKQTFTMRDNAYQGDGSSAITTTCENVEAAARFLDWAYSEEGALYYNFGTPGVSYNMINNYPTYTDMITKNPGGWPITQAMASYSRPHHWGAFIQDVRYIEQYMALPAQKLAFTTWPVPGTARQVPPITPTPEESSQYASIMGEVNTYVAEMKNKFILGTEPFANRNAYVATLRQFGIDRAVQMRNTALTRFNNR